MVVIAHSRSLAYTKLNLIRRLSGGEPAYFLILLGSALRNVGRYHRAVTAAGEQPAPASEGRPGPSLS